MKTQSIKFLALAAAAGCLTQTTQATTLLTGDVTGGTADAAGGVFIKLTVPIANPLGPPNSVGNDTFQLPNLYAFDEDQNIVLAAALSVNIIAGGGPLILPAGTEVASHYVFFDPGPTQSQTGYAEFDSDILAVITSTGLLAASDFLANTGVNYLNPAARGLEVGDSATIDPGLANRLLVDWDASTPGDYVRVLTKRSPGAVPDAGSTLVLLGCGMAVVGALRRYRS